MPKTVLTFLLAIANRESHAVSLIAAHACQNDAYFCDDSFIFTLSALHDLICAADASFHLSYLPFRQSLYRGELNTQLAKYEFCVRVHHSTGDVDTSQYCLVMM
jgi:hypothetical protein